MTDKTEAQELLASRRSVYGDRVQNMERTAKLWSALLGIEIQDWQVPLMMSAYKMLRTFETPDYSDNSDDIDGWKEMFVEVMTANHGGIIKARTVEEYHAQKAVNEAWEPETDEAKLAIMRQEAWQKSIREQKVRAAQEAWQSHVEERKEREAMETWKNTGSCGVQVRGSRSGLNGACILHIGHGGLHRIQADQDVLDRFADSGVAGDPDAGLD